MTIEKEQLQHLFDVSLKHIRKQGKPSFKGLTGACMYRKEEENGEVLGCAAAPFIRYHVHDDNARPVFESKPWFGLVDFCRKNEMLGALEPLAVEHYAFVGELQRAHDNPSLSMYTNNTIEGRMGEGIDIKEFMSRYEDNMKDIAERYELEYESRELSAF